MTTVELGSDRQVTAPSSGFIDLMRSEWTKIRSVRSTIWTLLATVVVSIGMSMLATSIYAGGWNTLSADDRQQMVADPIGLILQPGFQWGQVAIGVLGVLLVAGEFSTGMIRSSLLAVPTRTPFLIAKAATFAIIVFVLCELIAFTNFFAGRAIISKHVPISLGDPGVLRAVIGAGLFMTLAGLFAMAIGALLRHVAAAITVSFACVFVLPNATSFLPGKLGDYVSTYLPGGDAGQMIMSSGKGGDFVVGPWSGLAIAFGWTVLFFALAAVSLRRRDV
jgi:ABC-2 type transport system permease protein